jgi:putative DNA primase/helicase
MTTDHKAGASSPETPEIKLSASLSQFIPPLEPSEEVERLPAKKDFLSATLPTPSTPPTRREVLTRILGMVGPINFRELAKVTEDIKVLRGHQKVVVVRELLRVARINGFGMCRRNDVSYVFNGAFWVPVEHDEMKGFLGAVAEKMGTPEVTAHDAEFRELLWKQYHSSAHLQSAEPDSKKIVINLLNGTFEFSSEGPKLREYQAEDFITYQLPFAHDPDATAPLFWEYLNRVLPDPQRQQVLGEYCGYIFTKGLKLERALVLFGSGANGKSVFFEVLKAVLGPENCSSYSINRLTSSSGPGDYTRARLENKLVNYAPEISGISDVGHFKQLVSIEPIEARHPYGRPFTLRDYAKLIVNCNELPRVSDHSEGFFRRFLIVPFDVTIPEHERDIHLADKIIATELPGVFNWMLEGLERIMKNGRFSECQASEDVLQEYVTESDTAALFMTEQGYHPSPDKTLGLDELFKEYQEFCNRDGYRGVSKKNFSKRLRHQRYQQTRRNRGMVIFAEKSPIPPDAPNPMPEGGAKV